MANSAGWEWLTNLQFVTLETFVIQFIILLVVLWVLNKFIFRPYLEYLDQWEEKQKKLEEGYKNIDTLVSDAEKKKEEILKKARKKGDTIVADLESLGKTKGEEILAKAESDAKSLLETSKLEIEKERLSMMNSLKTNVIDLVLKMNEKLFWDEKISKEHLEKEIQSLK